VLNVPDKIIDAGKTEQNVPAIIFEKRVGENIVYVQTISPQRGVIRGKTLYVERIKRGAAIPTDIAADAASPHVLNDRDQTLPQRKHYTAIEKNINSEEGDQPKGEASFNAPCKPAGEIAFSL